MPKLHKRATIHDVASAAGVTHTTVSLVIKEHPRISQQTKDKVRQVIKDLDYRPNRTAQRLAGGKNNTIAVVASFFSSYFELEFMRGLQMAMGLTTHNLSQYSTRANERTKNDIFDQIINENLAEGVICLNLKPDTKVLERYKRQGVPVVLVEEDMAGAIVIRTNNYEGAYKATSHLIQRGYKNIALLSGALVGDETGSSPMERYEGYCAALAMNRLSVNDDYIYETEDYEIGDGYRILEQMREEHPEIDAVFCAAGDMVAYGMMKYAKRHGISIPSDIAMVGYDDHFTSEIAFPSLTTMSQPIYSMGHTALTTLMKALLTSSEDVIQHTVFSAKLMVRETS